MTSLDLVFDAFFAMITDDMYLEISKEQTLQDCKSLLLRSLPLFEFPNKVIRLTKDKDGNDAFSIDLTLEEINILAVGMVEIWLQRQINNIELTRQKYTGADFKMTSQAAHMRTLMTSLSATKDEHRRLQMLYGRRRENTRTGEYESNFDLLVKRMK